MALEYDYNVDGRIGFMEFTMLWGDVHILSPTLHCAETLLPHIPGLLLKHVTVTTSYSGGLWQRVREVGDDVSSQRVIPHCM